MRIQHWVFLITLLSSSAIYAQAPQINIRTDPALSSSQRTYEEALKSLTPEQTAQLTKLDDLATAAEEPNFQIISMTATVNACTANDIEKKNAYAPMMQGFTIDRIGQAMNLREKVWQQMNAIDFVDQKILNAHLGYQRNLSTQLMMGMSEVAAKGGIYTPEKCKEDLAPLEEKYAGPYAPTTSSSFDRPIYTEYVGMTQKGCTLSLATQSENRTITTIIVYTAGDEGTNFEFSGKVISAETGPLPVADLWINFGRVDTRLTAQTAKPGTPLFLGRFPKQLLADVLKGLRDSKTVISIQATDESKPHIFMPAATTAENADKFASCVTIIDPPTTDSLTKAGFKIDPQSVERVTIDPAEIMKKMKQ